MKGVLWSGGFCSRASVITLVLIKNNNINELQKNISLDVANDLSHKRVKYQLQIFCILS
jgi:hypothetical protein